MCPLPGFFHLCEKGKPFRVGGSGEQCVLPSLPVSLPVSSLTLRSYTYSKCVWGAPPLPVKVLASQLSAPCVPWLREMMAQDDFSLKELLARPELGWRLHVVTYDYGFAVLCSSGQKPTLSS